MLSFVVTTVTTIFVSRIGFYLSTRIAPKIIYSRWSWRKQGVIALSARFTVWVWVDIRQGLNSPNSRKLGACHRFYGVWNGLPEAMGAKKPACVGHGGLSLGHSSISGGASPIKT